MGKGPKVPQSAIDSTIGLQSTETGLLSKYADIALPYLSSAGSYWTALMKGGPAAQAATAPYAERIAAQTDAAGRQITQNLPAGGERNLASAQLPIAKATNIAGLYAGLGPEAAAQLQSLALGTAGAGTGSGSVAANAGGTLANLAGQQAQSKGNMFGGIGAGVGSLLGGYLGGPAFAASKAPAVAAAAA